ncbi:MAG: hypothetical protein Kow0069_29090 [Promethearchaeota archaeon]
MFGSGCSGWRQLHRKLVRHLDALVAVSDTTVRGLETASSIVRAAAKFTPFDAAHLVVNKVPTGDGGLPPTLTAAVGTTGARLLGVLPRDPELEEVELRGAPLSELPPDSPFARSARRLARRLWLPGH